MFDDEGIYLAAFRDEYFVVCPKCEAQTIVRPAAKTTASCVACGFSRVADEPSLAPAVGNAMCNCGRCRKPLTRRLNGGKRAGKVEIRCPGCGAISEANVAWSVPTEVLRDPIVGLPLWFQTCVGSQVLWAFNPKHLAFLDQYVRADIRSRKPNLNQTLASRLPKWLKARKNRAAILKAIAKMSESGSA